MASRKFRKSARKFNLFVGTLIFALLIGNAFSFGLVFRIGFVVGFVLAVYNKTLEKKTFASNFLIFNRLGFKVCFI